LLETIAGNQCPLPVRIRIPGDALRLERRTSDGSTFWSAVAQLPLWADDTWNGPTRKAAAAAALQGGLRPQISNRAFCQSTQETPVMAHRRRSSISATRVLALWLSVSSAPSAAAHAAGAVNVAGRVTDPQGSSVAGARLTLTTSSGSTAGEAVADEH